jgi:hypothetical protein
MYYNTPSNNNVNMTIDNLTATMTRHVTTTAATTGQYRPRQEDDNNHTDTTTTIKVRAATKASRNNQQIQNANTEHKQRLKHKNDNKDLQHTNNNPIQQTAIITRQIKHNKHNATINNKTKKI